MVSRKSKLLAAGIVLAAGLGLAWPLRLTGVQTKAPAGEATTATIGAPGVQPTLRVEAAVTAPPPTATVQVIAVSSSGPADPFAADRRLDSAAPPFDGIAAPPPTEDEAPEGRVHIVHNGDTLERLAERYLQDEGRALEIFDLNRQSLHNPHVLPIGVELRIPVAGPKSAEGEAAKTIEPTTVED